MHAPLITLQVCGSICINNYWWTTSPWKMKAGLNIDHNVVQSYPLYMQDVFRPIPGLISYNRVTERCMGGRSYLIHKIQPNLIHVTALVLILLATWNWRFVQYYQSTGGKITPLYHWHCFLCCTILTIRTVDICSQVAGKSAQERAAI